MNLKFILHYADGIYMPKNINALREFYLNNDVEKIEVIICQNK